MLAAASVARLAGSVASLYSEFFQVGSLYGSSHLPVDNPPCSFPLDGIANGSPVTPEPLGALRILAIHNVYDSITGRGRRRPIRLLG